MKTKASKNKLKYLAIIPARGGSKRIPRKNLALLAGKPLIEYSIREALASKSLDRVVVSTDDPEIAKFSERLGAAVPFLRPRAMAGDRSPVIPALCHVVERLEEQGEEFDAILLLQPTSPLRTRRHIDEAVVLFEKTGADSLTSVMTVRQHPYYAWTMDAKGMLKPFFSYKHQAMIRQQLPPAFMESGAIFISKVSDLRKGTLYGKKVVPYLMSPEESIDIDEPADLAVAEGVMRRIKKCAQKKGK